MREALGINRVTNESKTTMFTSPLFTGNSTFGGSLIPSASSYYIGNASNRWNGIYLSPTAFINFGNNISISGVSDRLRFGNGHLDMANSNIYSTGNIGTNSDRISRLYVDSLFSNYSNIVYSGNTFNSPTLTGTILIPTAGSYFAPNISVAEGTNLIIGGNSNKYIVFDEMWVRMNHHLNMGDYGIYANAIGDDLNPVSFGAFSRLLVDTAVFYSIGMPEYVVPYGYFNDLNIKNRPTVGDIPVALVSDISGGGVGIPANLHIDSITTTNYGYSVYKNGEIIPPNIPEESSDNPYDIFTVPHVFPSDTSAYPIPDKPGDFFIDTVAEKIYISVSARRGGWIMINMILPVFIYVRRRRMK